MRVRTFQEPHRSVETFRAELIVAERAQELAHENIGFFWDVNNAHVPKAQRDFILPFFILPLLEAIWFVNQGRETSDRRKRT